MDEFDLIDDFEDCFDKINEDEKNEIVKDTKYDMCPQCDVTMSVHTNYYICARCGYIKDNVEVVTMNTITSDNSYNSIVSGLRCVGNNAHRYQTILRSQSSYDVSPELHVRNILFSYNYAVGKDGSIPKDILLTVHEQFKQIRIYEKSIYRGSILKAILAAMTYYECLKRKMSYKPSDIYTWFDVDPSTYSKGDKKIRELLDYGHYDEDLRSINAESNYLQAYAAKLKISEYHIECIVELLEVITKQTLLNPNAKSSTQALCVLYLYLTAVKHPITIEEFKVTFKCNFGTIRAISMDLIDRKDKLVHVFKKYEIDYSGIAVHSEKIKRNVKKRRNKVGRIQIG